MSDVRRCLCCQKPIDGSIRYHPGCLQRLFGTARPPEIPFGVADLPAEISRLGSKMSSISGVQKKVLVVFDRSANRLVISRGSTHILKTETNEYPELPRNENLCMNIVEGMGFKASPHGLFLMKDGTFCYMTKRFDRMSDGQKIPKEDMAQLLGFTSETKYNGSLEMVGKAIQRHTQNPGLDAVDFLERLVLSYLIGNGDMHIKNWGVYAPDGKNFHLAPCYDFVSSGLYIPDETESALTLNGKRHKLQRSDFEALAQYLGIEPKATENVFVKFRRSKDKIILMVSESELSPAWKDQLKLLIEGRYGKLF